MEVEIPDDVKELLKELERRGVKPSLVAVERTPETYDTWRDGKYVGVLPSDEVYKERNLVVCGKLTCACFLDDVLRYAWQREEKKLHEPEEW
ncbi:MAG: hypothetical protein QXT64_03755 [Desulfurococcaceae archaeon]